MNDTLSDTVRELSGKPGHEKVRALVYRLLTDALNAPSEGILFEQRMPEVRGRVDALVGRTLIEVKSDLKREESDAEAQLARYLPQRESETGQRYVGIATDGALFRAYEMRGDELTRLTEHKPDRNKPYQTPIWLDGVVAVRDQLPADAPNILAELGRESTAFARANGLLAAVWDRLKDHPEAKLKRQLWERHLALVYGKAVENDDLWVQHTYLVCVAKAIATAALTGDYVGPEDLLAGRAFTDAGIHGAVESDFFDWVLEDDDGITTVRRIVQHARRFDLSDIKVDLLKVLYESLIDPEKRHDLGEYYTPDWLAAKVTREAMREPATDRVIDPSCGSGTFLFHAVRQKRAALVAESTPEEAIAARCVETVHGLDIHPVAVIIARVTVLLALGRTLQDRDDDISVPVYLGNAMQWDVHRDEHDLVVEVPPDGSKPKKDAKIGAPTLRFPLDVCRDGNALDRVVEAMYGASEAREKPVAFERRLTTLGIDPAHHATLRATFERYHALNMAGRDHIWGYVARNLSRPVALSDGGKMDVVLGNPPWLSYRYMSTELKKRFKDASKAIGLWVSKEEGRLVTQTDLSGYFFAKSMDLYLRPGGRITMVLPLATMTRGQFRRFRTGEWYGVRARFTDAWVLDNQDIAPLFRVPTCVLFAERSGPDAKGGVRVPDRVRQFHGRPPRKDASEDEADPRVRVFEADAPSEVSYEAASPYRERFRQGATLVPRMLCYVERAAVGRLGSNRNAPAISSARSNQEKAPWKDAESITGRVEASCLRTGYLGSSIAPFRVLEQPEAVVPVAEVTRTEDDGTERVTAVDVLTSKQAKDRGLPRVSSWLAQCEALWDAHGTQNLTFKGRIDFGGGLSTQFPVAPIRVVYSKAGTRPAATVLRDARGVVDHTLYWMATESENEAHYLAALLNAEAVRARIEHLQARGEQGARHFDKLFFTLPIPTFDPCNRVHTDLAEAARRAEAVAA